MTTSINASALSLIAAAGLSLSATDSVTKAVEGVTTRTQGNRRVGQAEERIAKAQSAIEQDKLLIEAIKLQIESLPVEAGSLTAKVGDKVTFKTGRGESVRDEVGTVQLVDGSKYKVLVGEGFNQDFKIIFGGQILSVEAAPVENDLGL